MITITSLAEMTGISVGEQLVNSLIRLGIQSDHTYGCAVHVVDYYIDHSTDEKEIKMLRALKKVMEMDYYIDHSTDEKEIKMLRALKKVMKMAKEIHD